MYVNLVVFDGCELVSCFLFCMEVLVEIMVMMMWGSGLETL